MWYHSMALFVSPCHSEDEQGTHPTEHPLHHSLATPWEQAPSYPAKHASPRVAGLSYSSTPLIREQAFHVVACSSRNRRLLIQSLSLSSNSFLLAASSQHPGARRQGVLSLPVVPIPNEQGPPNHKALRLWPYLEVPRVSDGSER